MKIEVYLLNQSNPITYNEVVNVYVEEGMYCILEKDDIINKFPMVNIFRVREFPEEIFSEDNIDVSKIELFKTDIKLPLEFGVYLLPTKEFDIIAGLSDDKLDGANLIVTKKSILLRDGN